MWSVSLDEAFRVELARFDRKVRIAILQAARLLEVEGPQLGRPRVDTLKGSRHANMKELRPTVNKVEWRVAFAFDPKRRAVLLAAAAKGGHKRAYDKLIRTADKRFDAHLAATAKEGEADGR
jgi:hypothetical protein